MLKNLLTITVANGLSAPDNMPIPNENKKIETIIFIIVAIAILFLVSFFVCLFRNSNKTKKQNEKTQKSYHYIDTEDEEEHE